MAELYALKFETVLKEKVWGGKFLASEFNKKSPELRIVIRRLGTISSADDHL